MQGRRFERYIMRILLQTVLPAGRTTKNLRKEVWL